MKKEVENRIKSEQKYDCAEFSSFDDRFRDTAWRLVQIPGYFVICRYHGRIYVDVMNGVTGEVYGGYPFSNIKVTIAFIIVTAFVYALLLISGYMTDDVLTVCTDGTWRTDWDTVLLMGEITGITALLIYACLGFVLWLGARREGSLKRSPWLSEIVWKSVGTRLLPGSTGTAVQEGK